MHPALSPQPIQRLLLLSLLASLLTVLASARPLFDGSSLAGWSIQNGGRFSVRDGMIVLDRGSGWLRSDATFADFTLTVEVRFLDPNANSGIFVRTGPASRNDDKGYPSNGYQVQCMDNVDGAHPLASVIAYGGPLADAPFDRDAIGRAIRPTGEWNVIEISCRGELIVSKLNGVEVARGVGVGRRSGHVGIQGEGGRLEFRRIDLADLPPVPFVADGSELVFAGTAAQLVESQSLSLLSTSQAPTGLVARITGPHASAFRLVGPAEFTLKPGEARAVSFHFRSGPEQVGVLTAACEISDESGALLHVVGLHGLSAPGLEGKREPPLRLVLQTLGYAVDIGWDTLAGNLEPAPLGAEVRGQRFRAAGPGDIVMTPVARYSPDFLLPFGFYATGDERPELHVVGTLAKATSSRPEHNILHPSLASGRTHFAPPTGSFGLFTASPSHVAYTEDALNTRLEPNNAAHAVRVYPARDRVGQPIPNAFLVCFEEATNGDYQDYVFLLENAQPSD